MKIMESRQITIYSSPYIMFNRTVGACFSSQASMQLEMEDEMNVGTYHQEEFIKKSAERSRLAIKDGEYPYLFHLFAATQITFGPAYWSNDWGPDEGWE